MPQSLAVLVALIVLATNAALAAPISPPDLARLLAVTQHPETAHLDVVTSDLNLGPGFVIDEWNLTDGGRVLINFSRLKNDPYAWQLDVLRSTATLAQLAPSARALYSVTSPEFGDVKRVSLIQSGPFKNRFLERTVFSDQSVTVTIVDRRYVLASGQRWEALGSGVPEAETTYRYLRDKVKFCKQPHVRCRT